MDITLEKIDLVRERSGVTYRKAVEALEREGGDPVKALMSLEEKGEGEKRAFGGMHEDRRAELAEKLKELLGMGGRYRIKVVARERKIVELPLGLGVLSSLFFPRLTVWGVLGLLFARCSLEMEKSAD